MALKAVAFSCTMADAVALLVVACFCKVVKSISEDVNKKQLQGVPFLRALQVLQHTGRKFHVTPDQHQPSEPALDYPNASAAVQLFCYSDLEYCLLAQQSLHVSDQGAPDLACLDQTQSSLPVAVVRSFFRTQAVGMAKVRLVPKKQAYPPVIEGFLHMSAQPRQTTLVVCQGVMRW